MDEYQTERVRTMDRVVLHDTRLDRSAQRLAELRIHKHDLLEVVQTHPSSHKSTDSANAL